MRAQLAFLVLLIGGHVAPAGPAVLAAQASPLPKALSGFKPHEIPQSALANRGALQLSEQQVTALTQWHTTITKEQHQYAPSSNIKNPNGGQHKPMISRDRAYEKTAAILTPTQRGQWLNLAPAWKASLPRQPALDSGNPLTHEMPASAGAPRGRDSASHREDPLLHREGVPPARPGDTTGQKAEPMTHQPR